MTERDLQELEQAARLIITVIERHHVEDENAYEKRMHFRIVNVENEESPDVGTSGNVEQGFVEFTEKEIQQMPKNFRKLILVNRKRCRMRKHPSGKNSTTYEIRYRRDGYNITACGKTIELAKENMIEKMKTAKPRSDRSDEERFPSVFENFARYYFEKFRKPKVAELTYQNDELRLRKHILPALGNKEIKKITPSDCEDLIGGLRSAGKGKTADEVRSLLSILFKGAIAHGIIERNPILLVPHVRHEYEHGESLTHEEESALFEKINDTPYEILYSLALYCGLRPNEIKSATVQGDFIVAINSKRKNKKVEYKKIPICKKLAAHLKKVDFDLSKIDLRVEKTLSMRFPKFCPNHKLYDLRTTFYSRCKELGVAEPALKEFAGHSLGALGNAYTDLSEKYLLKEGKKLNRW